MPEPQPASLTWPAQHRADIAAADDLGDAARWAPPLTLSPLSPASARLRSRSCSLAASRAAPAESSVQGPENNRRQTPPRSTGSAPGPPPPVDTALPRAPPPDPGSPRSKAPPLPRQGTRSGPCPLGHFRWVRRWEFRLYQSAGFTHPPAFPGTAQGEPLPSLVKPGALARGSLPSVLRQSQHEGTASTGLRSPRSSEASFHQIPVRGTLLAPPPTPTSAGSTHPQSPRRLAVTPAVPAERCPSRLAALLPHT